MRKKRFLLLFFVCLITFLCILKVNQKYDRLARYQYDDQEARTLIKSHLSNREIDYIIEYAIEPNYFKKFITCENFNIYLCDLYNLVQDNYWYISPQDSVNYVYKAWNSNITNVEEFIKNHFSYEVKDVMYYLNNHLDKELIDDPSIVGIEVNENSYFSTYVPTNLVSLNGVYVKQEVATSYYSLMNKIDELYKTDKLNNPSNKITIENGYLSFDEIKKLNNANIVPGQNYHQLGYCIDLDLNKSIFNTEDKLIELNQLIKEFGFINEKCEIGDYHLRYVGTYE